MNRTSIPVPNPLDFDTPRPPAPQRARGTTHIVILILSMLRFLSEGFTATTSGMQHREARDELDTYHSQPPCMITSCLVANMFLLLLHREREEGRGRKGNIGTRAKRLRDTQNQNVSPTPRPPGTKAKALKLAGAGPTPNPIKLNPPTPKYPTPSTTPKRK